MSGHVTILDKKKLLLYGCRAKTTKRHTKGQLLNVGNGLQFVPAMLVCLFLQNSVGPCSISIMILHIADLHVGFDLHVNCDAEYINGL
jgi:hypothetical protein